VHKQVRDEIEREDIEAYNLVSWAKGCLLRSPAKSAYGQLGAQLEPGWGGCAFAEPHRVGAQTLSICMIFLCLLVFLRLR
jgi:hypothetical protein